MVHSKILAVIIIFTMLGSLLPFNAIVLADPVETTTGVATLGMQRYLENFEDGNVANVISAHQDGWSTTGDYASTSVSGFGRNGSQGVRFSATTWTINNELNLNLKESAVAKLKANGVADAKANASVAELTNGKVMLGFTFSIDRDKGDNNMNNGSRTYLSMKDNSGNAFITIEADVTDVASDNISLNLIALNEAKTANVRYPIATGKASTFYTLRDIQVYLNPSNNTYKLVINNEAYNGTPHGEWIPASTTGVVGSASAATTLSLKNLAMGNANSNWWGGVIVDTITMNDWSFVNYSGSASAPEKPVSMWYRTPADKWASSLPLGNGRIGAMIWGGVTGDTVSLNDVTCWSGEDQTGKNLENPNGPTALEAVRAEMLKASPNPDTVNTLMKQFGGSPNYDFGTNRPFGNLTFGFNTDNGEISNYRRSLDLETSMSYVNFSNNNADYTRESFVSNPDQVMAMKFSSTGSNKVSFEVAYEPENVSGGAGVTSVDGDSLVFNGHTINKGVATYARLKAINTGGTVDLSGGTIKVTGANDVVLVLSLGTSFSDQNYKTTVDNRLAAAVAKGYNTLKAAHIADVQPLFNRMVVQIGDTQASNEPTDVRLEKIRNGAEIDGNFMSIWYQYARYLTIAGSRADSPLPMNLQGIWNDNVACNMAWTNDYHLDINIQMNQWMTNSSNLSEGELPIFKFMEEKLIPSGTKVASTQYGADGWVAPIMTNAWGYTGNTGDVGAWNGTTAAGGWLAQEIMNYFDHTWDTGFLQDRGLPMLKKTADFYLSYLVVNPADGYLVTIPSSSPENGNYEIMSTFDRTVIFDIFSQVLRSYNILGMAHDDYYTKVQTALSKLPPYKISKYGQLMEWMYNDTTDGNTDHRHTSNLLGLFPYDQITPDKTPELTKAAMESIQRKFNRPGYENTEWTAVNAQGFYARLKDGENAYKYLKMLGNTFSWPNLMSISPKGIALAPTDVYIIDGVLGMGETTAEMLLQSHSDRLEFLPALPKEWDKGHIAGMQANGAFTVDFDWADYKLAKAKITSNAGNKCTILKNASTNWTNTSVYQIENGEYKRINLLNENNSTISFNTIVGGVYVLLDETQAPLINDTDSSITWNGFNYHNDRAYGALNVDAHYADQQGSSFELSFNGKGIDVLAEVNDGDTGTAIDIMVDGQPYGTAVLEHNGGARKMRQVIYSVSGLSEGTHTIKGVLAQSGKYVVIDGFSMHSGNVNESKLTGQLMNDNDPRITYQGFEGQSCGRKIGDYLDDIHYTYSDASFKVDFTGTGFDVIGEKHSSTADLEIYIDGESTPSVTASPRQSQPVVKGQQVLASVRGLANTKHTATVVAKVNGGWFEFDALNIHGLYSVYINNDSPQVTYTQLNTDGNWRLDGNRIKGDYLGDIQYSDKTKNKATLEFTGTGVDVLVEKDAAFNDYEIHLDGQYVTTVSGSNVGSTVAQSVAWTVDGLSNSKHTLDVIVAETGGWGWGGALDGFVVRNSGEILFNPGIYQITNFDTDKSLSITDNNIVQGDNTGAYNQQWYFEKVGDGPCVRIINANSGKCLGVNGSGQAAQTDFVWDGSQEWNITPSYRSPGYSVIENRKSGLYLQVDMESFGDGSGVSPYGYQRKDHFDWKISTLSNGYKTIERKGSTSLLEIGGSDFKADGARAYINSKRMANDQKWNFVALGNGEYKIANVDNGLIISEQNGVVQPVVWSDSANNKWTLQRGMENAREYYTFINSASKSILLDTKWVLKQSGNDSNASPFVHDIKLNGKAIANTAATIEYQYQNASGITENGSVYKAYMLDSVYAALPTPFATGAASESFTIPAGFDSSKVLAFEITPKSADGVIGKSSFLIVTAPQNHENMYVTNKLYEENFNSDGIGSVISGSQNGWYKDGSNQVIKVEGMNNDGNSLGSVASGGWYNNNILGLDFTKSENKSINNLTGKVSVSFDMMFSVAGNINNYDPNSTPYISLKNAAGVSFATFRLRDFSLDSIGLDDGNVANTKYNIASGFENIFSKWHKVQVYVDTVANTYSVAVDGKFLEARYGINFPATSSTLLGASSPVNIGQVAKIELGNEWYSWDDGVWIDNLAIGNYSVGDDLAWSVKDLSLQSDALVSGQPSTFKVKIAENKAAPDGKMYVGLYKDQLMDIVALNDIKFDNAGICEKEFNVNIPRMSGDYTLKAFAWGGNMQPISATVPFIKLPVVRQFAVSNVFSNNMLLQANQPVKVWGVGSAGDPIDVVIKDSAGKVLQKSTVTDTNNEWLVTFDPFSYGGQYSITVTSGLDSYNYTNVTFGDVFLLAGQSNMEYVMDWLDETKADLATSEQQAKANNPNIRIVDLHWKGTDGSKTPINDIPTGGVDAWQLMTPDVAKNASILGYYFAQDIYATTRHPIGLLASAVGGTNMNSWIQKGSDAGSFTATDGRLFNNRVYPYRNLGMKGVLFYQGEADLSMPVAQYSDAMAGIIGNYRNLFGNNDLPFYYAQLMRYGNQNFENVKAAQTLALTKIANTNNTALIPTLDLFGRFSDTLTSGTARADIHPWGKKEVARRFANFAKNDLYGGNIIASGPMYKSMQVVGNTIELTFNATGSLKVMQPVQYSDAKTAAYISNNHIDTTTLQEFEIAGADGVYVKANATISGNKVILSSSQITSPQSARYAFGAYPECPNLTDDSNLPSTTFSTK